MVSEAKGKAQHGTLDAVLIRQTRRKQSQQGRIRQGILNKVDSQKRKKSKNVQAMTHAIMQSAIEATKAAVHAISQPGGTTKRNIAHQA